MPFKSSKQRKACFATNGFRGKIDCHEWAHAKMQGGGPMSCPEGMVFNSLTGECEIPGGETQQFPGNYNNPQATSMDIPNAPLMRSHYPSTGFNPNMVNSLSSPAQAAGSGQLHIPDPNVKKPINYRGIGLKGITTALSEISGVIERGRQNQYDYLQQTALGQMSPIPADNYQPNPYSLYAKFGGSLKKLQMGGMLARMKTQSQPTTGDSTLLYYNQLAKDAFYTKKKGYTSFESDTQNKDIPHIIEDIKLEQKSNSLYNDQGWGIIAESINKAGKFPRKITPKEVKNRYGNVAGTVYQSPDILLRTTDSYFNPDAPASYVSNVIKPKKWTNYSNHKYGDASDVPMYDAVAIKPWHLLNDKEKAARTGKPVQPVVYQKKQSSIIPLPQSRHDLDKLSRDKTLEEVWVPDNSVGKGGQRSIGFRKKVAPIPPQPQEPNTGRPSAIPRTQVGVQGSVGQPNIGVPNMGQAGFDSSKPTNYSFTNPTGPYLQQNTQYFPDEQSWKAFLRGAKNVSSQQTSNSGTATGNFKKGGKWIQKAVNPEHKGYCTPMSKATCTPRRKALARTFKKHHGFHGK